MKVSIIVPTYNEPLKYLTYCFDSIKEQTYKDYEVIVVDDCGSNCKEVRDLCKKYGFRYVRHEINKGIGATRNTGVAHAHGDYIYFISSDDAMVPETLEVFVNASKQLPNVILYSHYLMMNEVNELVATAMVPVFKSKRDFKIACWKNALENTMFVCFDVIFIPADVIKKHKFLNSLRFGEDLEWLLRMALVENYDFALISAKLAHYRVHPENTTSRTRKDIPNNNVKIRERIKKLMLRKWRKEKS